MGKIEKIDLMVDGGNAKPDASIAQRLGPLKINIGEVMKKINDKTAGFKGMKIPVKVEVNVETKEVGIEVGTPPVSELVKKELALEKGSGTPNREKIRNIGVETLIKIAKMKMDGMLVNSLKSAVKSIAGSCNSMGILIEGKLSNEFTKDLESGKYDKELASELTDVSSDKQKLLEKELTAVNEKIKKELERLKREAEKAAEAAPVVAAAPAAEAGAEAKAAEGAPAKGKEATTTKAAAPAKAEEKKPAGKEEKKK